MILSRRILISEKMKSNQSNNPSRTISTHLSILFNQVTTPKIQSLGFRGLITYLDVTAASGTGGLRVGLVYCDPINSSERLLLVASNPVTTTGLTQIVWGEGCGAGAGVSLNAAAGQGYVGIMLPKNFKVLVTHGDASSYTYALNLEFVP